MDITVFRMNKKSDMLKSYLTVISSLVLFYAVICTPANLLVNSNIMLLQTILPLCIDFLMIFANFLFYWISFAYLLYFLFEFGFQNSRRFLVSYAIVVFLRYAFNLLAGYFVMGFPTMEEFFAYTFLYFLIDIVMDLVQMGFALLIVLFVLRKTEETSFAKQMPFVRLFDMANPLLRAAFLVSIVPSAISLLSRLIYDVIVGFPVNLADLLWMVTYYLFDVLSVLIGYFMIQLLLGYLHGKNQKWEDAAKS